MSYFLLSADVICLLKDLSHMYIYMVELPLTILFLKEGFRFFILNSPSYLIYLFFPFKHLWDGDFTQEIKLSTGDKMLNNFSLWPQNAVWTLTPTTLLDEPLELRGHFLCFYPNTLITSVCAYFVSHYVKRVHQKQSSLWKKPCLVYNTRWSGGFTMFRVQWGNGSCPGECHSVPCSHGFGMWYLGHGKSNLC